MIVRWQNFTFRKRHTGTGRAKKRYQTSCLNRWQIMPADIDVSRRCQKRRVPGSPRLPSSMSPSGGWFPLLLSFFQDSSSGVVFLIPANPAGFVSCAARYYNFFPNPPDKSKAGSLFGGGFSFLFHFVFCFSSSGQCIISVLYSTRNGRDITGFPSA